MPRDTLGNLRRESYRNSAKQYRKYSQDYVKGHTIRDVRHLHDIRDKVIKRRAKLAC